MHEVLLLNPPPITSKSYIKELGAGGEAHVDAVYPPLKLAYVAAMVREKDIPIDLLDANALNMKIDEFRDYLSKKQFCLAILNTVTCSYPSDLKTVHLIKEILPECEIALFGQFATAMSDEIIIEKSIDYVIVGEPEITCSELSKQVLENRKFEQVDGLVWKKNNEPIQNKPRELIEDLDSLPLPARDLLPIEKYKHTLSKSNPFMFMTSGRGCLSDCLFCGTKSIYKKTWRGRNPTKVVDEMQEIREKYGIRDIWIWDENFLLVKKRTIQICEEIIDRNLDVDLCCMGRVDGVDEEVIDYLSKAGCYTINYGVETSDTNTLKKIRKNISLEQVEKAFRITRKAGIKTAAYLLIGLPGENFETVKRTLHFVKKLKPDLAIYHIVVPYPGTDFYIEAIKNEWIITDDWEKFNERQSVLSYPDFTAKDIEHAQRWAYIHFYMDPFYLFRQFTQIRSLNELKGFTTKACDYINIIREL